MWLFLILTIASDGHIVNALLLNEVNFLIYQSIIECSDFSSFSEIQIIDKFYSGLLFYQSKHKYLENISSSHILESTSFPKEFHQETSHKLMFLKYLSVICRKLALFLMPVWMLVLHYLR